MNFHYVYVPMRGKWQGILSPEAAMKDVLKKGCPAYRKDLWVYLSQSFENLPGSQISIVWENALENGSSSSSLESKEKM